MGVEFRVTGRLGNAIFRYLACVIMCIYYNATYDGIYSVNGNKNIVEISDEYFKEILEGIINNKTITPINQNSIILMNKFYQHDLIYKLHKQQIFDFIWKNPTHFVLTDGILAGDGKLEKFYMVDILNTPVSFTKRYKNVLHLRLEDFVKYNLYLDKDRIIDLLNKNIIEKHLCIVCKAPTTDFENEYINYIKEYLKTKNIEYTLEHNDTLTDYYIMKEAELLICSKSTLSWCAAFFSDKIKKCYLPDYVVSPNSTCKNPIDETELY